MKALKIQQNQVGKRYALVCKEGKFSVWAECSNYSRHVPGGIEKSWRYCERELSQETAEKLFEKKLKGKQR
jgi:uncharacterized protein YbdZ (MbtH family)